MNVKKAWLVYVNVLKEEPVRTSVMLVGVVVYEEHDVLGTTGKKDRPSFAVFKCFIGITYENGVAGLS